ncbi:hypothetical protein [Pedobacter endophyticus]|uniref:Uncharacterized protein n=1 Tax=Pedobacter endophyticus TaxID=2789740 RepID=A0A7S9KZ55_9SPHI|nr:hypothetical protein [Pedobacter endophyticus]QPH39509.1 hypothetical protein IZT61_21120 [Pedobacter endophyticus]
MKKFSILALFVVAVSSCSITQNTAGGDAVSLTGNLQKLNTTTYQYGTHSINSGGKPYALKSSSLNLDTWVDKQVTLRGNKVSGYPLEGGPDLIEVSEVVMK